MSSPQHPWLDDTALLDNFAEKITEMCLNYLKPKEGDLVVEFTDPKTLAPKLNLGLGETTAMEELLVECSKVFKYSVNTNHRHFFNQLYAGADTVAFLGEWMTAALNGSMYTYEVAPVFVLMEKYVLEQVGSLMGFKPEEVDGIFSPGGSVSNCYSIEAARHRLYPESKMKGMKDIPRLVGYASEHAHYSIKKSFILMGLGAENCVLIRCDEFGRMIPDELERAIQKTKDEGGLPFYVNATGGTTVYGAYDPFETIADICEKNSLWMHLDGAWGGAAMFSAKHKPLLKGSHRADSFTFNPHKLLGVPQQCSVIVMRHKGILADCNSVHAKYLFQKDKLGYDPSYDTGDKSIQCGRRVEVFKFWLSWKAHGSAGLEERVNRAFHNAQYLTEQIKARSPNFEMVVEGPHPQCTNVCFWYVPPSLHGKSHEERKEQLNKVAPVIKYRMQLAGSCMINFQPFQDLPNFFRMVVMNPKVTVKDMDFVLDEIEKLGSDL